MQGLFYRKNITINKMQAIHQISAYLRQILLYVFDLQSITPPPFADALAKENPRSPNPEASAILSTFFILVFSVFNYMRQIPVFLKEIVFQQDAQGF